MEAKIIDGKRIAAQLQQYIRKDITMLGTQYGIMPALAVIVVGDDPRSLVYAEGKQKACSRLGMRSETINMPANASEKELLSTVMQLNDDHDIHGILVDFPLPPHINAGRISEAIAPDKDVDGFHPLNAGRLRMGSLAGMIPCTPYGIIKMLELSNIPIVGQQAVVIGASNIVGKPMASLLLELDATVTICHTKTVDLPHVARQADILVVAIGQPEFIGPEYVKPGATVIDVGINMVDGRLCGDVDFAAVSKVAGAITPVPGGVGALTTTMLLYNTVKAAKLQLSAGTITVPSGDRALGRQ